MKFYIQEIESERRSGYAWYGTWGDSLLRKPMPNGPQNDNVFFRCESVVRPFANRRINCTSLFE
ncbi:MAG: pectate lyase [Pirellulaceae bacterium]